MVVVRGTPTPVEGDCGALLSGSVLGSSAPEPARKRDKLILNAKVGD